jgi:hypothetical protein
MLGGLARREQLRLFWVLIEPLPCRRLPRRLRGRDRTVGVEPVTLDLACFFCPTQFLQQRGKPAEDVSLTGGDRVAP